MSAPSLIPDNTQPMHDSARAMMAALEYLAKQIDLSTLNVRKDFSLLNAHAGALSALAAARAAGWTPTGEQAPEIVAARQVWLRYRNGKQARTTWGEFILTHPGQTAAAARAMHKGGQYMTDAGATARLW